MRYTQPQVIARRKGTFAIQGAPKPVSNTDSIDMNTLSPSSAYEADE